ncbi:MAG: response regulator transcription factor [Gammaproteobacteria bacterium]|nr:response regulator transcription factor [Gammaproteobacteria bacterium]
MSPIQLFVLAKSDIFLDGLIRILDENEHINVHHFNNTDKIEFNSQPNAKLQHIAPDIILIQSQLITSPFDFFFKQLKSKFNSPNLKFMVFGQSMDNDFLLNVIRSGANGYINSNMSTKHLLQAIKYINEGNMWVERHILEQLAQDALQMENILEQIAMEKTRMISDLLTKREAQVFQWILKGLSTKEIAEQIYLSEQSVKLHLGKLFKKFDVTNRPQLILSVFERASPVNNIIPLIQATLEKKHLNQKQTHPDKNKA